MHSLRLAFFAAAVAAGTLTVFACGDDEDAIVRQRFDAGPQSDAAADGGGCGLALPATYEAPAFDVNAAAELSLRASFEAFVDPMLDHESGSLDGGAPEGGVSASTLAALYAAGTPSLRGITTVYYQGKIDGYVADYEAASTAGTYTPTDPPTGPGKRANLAGSAVWYFNGRGVDLRQAIEKGLYNAAFFNHASLLVGPGQGISVATVDRLVAAFGAHPSFPNSPSAPQNKDVFAAAHAARRDSNDPATPGPYQRAKAALIKARAAVTAGDACNAERDAALSAFFLEWEKSQYATVVYAFVEETKKLAAPTKDAAAILHAHGEAIGTIGGFRTIDATRRKITDAQIDSLLQKAYAPVGAPAEAYKVVTDPNASASLAAAVAEIQSIYAFTAAEMKDFEIDYP